MSHGYLRRGVRGSVVSLVILAMAGWACATSDNVEPQPAGNGGNGGNVGTTGAAGDTGSGGNVGTAGAAGDGSSAGNNGTAGTTGVAGASGGSTAGTSGARGGAGGTAGTSGARGGAGGTSTAGTSGARGGAAGTSTARGGAGGTAGTSTARGGAGGTATAGTSGARGGATGTGGTPSTNLCTWPTAAGSQSVSSTINVSGTYDGGMKRFVGSGTLGGSGQTEGQDPLFQIANGGTLTNVIIGNPAADGVHCSGSCTLRNVWWEDVGEDAATLKGSSSSQVMTIDTGGAKAAADKVFQHNGPGTMIIKNFCAQDFGKLYRSCGNCSSQYTRHVEFDNVMIMPKHRAARRHQHELQRHREVHPHPSCAPARAPICDRYNGNSTGAEPTKIGSGADGTNCIYSASDITYMP